MNYIPYIVKFLYKIRYWLILAPILVALSVYWHMGYQTKNYTANSTIYTGIITGVNILSESGVTVTSTTQSSMMTNLMDIISSDQTLKNVSLRLYARCMVYGDPNKDNNYIQANHFRTIYNHGRSIHHLIDKSSTNDSINEVNTYNNLRNYEKNDPNNYVYGIYQWNLPYFNRAALKTIEVDRNGNSDLITLSYTTNDPGIAYQTLRLINDEFINQYQMLRFGETNNVIAYFEKELKRISQELRNAEDSLTDYSVSKRIINYEKETEQIAGLNSEYHLKYWDLYQTNVSAEHIINELETRMGINAKMYRQNSNFLSKMNKMTNLNSQFILETYNNDTNKSVKDSLENELKKTEEDFKNFAGEYGSLKYSKEGVSTSSVIEEWLNMIIIYEKTKAEMEALKRRKAELDLDYRHFAPIGSTLNRKQRSVSISEKEYFSIMSALNAARLRQKSLQMTSATLKVMDEPVFPITPITKSRKSITIAAFLATLVFIIFFFLIIELLDHTLHNKLKVEMLTKGKALGAFTRTTIRYRKYNQLYKEISAKHVCNLASTYFSPTKNNIINIISNEAHEGKSYILEQLETQFSEQGLEVKKLSWHTDALDAQGFIQSLDLNEIDSQLTSKDRVILVEYPSLKEAALTESILQGVSINLLVVNSRRTWKTTDQQLYERTKEMAGKTPLFFLLNFATRSAAEDFNGLMPPYTFFRKLFYRLSQLGLTAQDTHSNYV